MEQITPIAVVGIGGLFPGASDLETFWQNILNKIDTTREVTGDRWIVPPGSVCDPEAAPDKALSDRACLIHDFEFDPEKFDIDRKLLTELGPLYHAVLHAGRQAFLEAGMASTDPARIGTVLAAIALPTDAASFIMREILGNSFEARLFGDSRAYDSKSKNMHLSRNQCLAARVTSLPAAVLAKGLGLGGGSYTLDAACASSLYAVKLACDELRHHRADAMLAGGVSIPESLYTQIGFSQLRALSPSGRCAPFDEKADGLVVGEGAGMLVLKRLNDALRDGDHVYALIKGVGLSNDMKGNLLAPEHRGQLRAMRSAYESAGMSPHDIDLVECHGTGTPVGDHTELSSLRELWGKSGWYSGQCAIGSVKSMIGHLLTGAGAAGMIKVLLAMKHNILPPSLHFKQAPEGSPLHGSPFRVQTDPEKWTPGGNRTLRRAAVSGFGFGGINAHLIFEEWDPDAGECRAVKRHLKSTATDPLSSAPQAPVAIVGMAALFGSLETLADFQGSVFRGDSVIGMRPKNRWRGSDAVAEELLGGPLSYGGYMDTFSFDPGMFHIPPNEIPDILPQQLLMLKVAANAMADAGLEQVQERPRMGVVVGMEFDYEATRFQLRWNMENAILEWRKKRGIDLNDREASAWEASLRDAAGPPLTSTRTVGALGGIVASRIAREFRFGGPSFGVSGEAASGLRALEIGVRSLQENETDTVLVGAIDLFGDVRSIVVSNGITPFSSGRKIAPFDRSADGTLPGEGAAAIVLKRLDRAMEDGDRIYAVIKGIGSGGGGGIDVKTASGAAYSLSLERSFQDAGVSPSSISFIETHGSGKPMEDHVESVALHAVFSRSKTSCAIGSVKPNIGHTGAAAGLASLVKTALCLYQEIIPPLKNFVSPKNDTWKNGTFYFPAFPQYWFRDRKDGPRRAVTCAMTSDGNCMHIILEGIEYESQDTIPEKAEHERKRPLGYGSHGLFVVEGNDKEEMISGLDALDCHIKAPALLSESPSPSKEKFLVSGKDMEVFARSWYLRNRSDPDKKFAVSIVAADVSQLEAVIRDAGRAIASGTSLRMNGSGGASYSTAPLGPNGKIAFVFPGSGNHYVGMGRDVGVHWPEVLRKMDIDTRQLKTQFVPGCYVPWRTDWEPEWAAAAYEKIASDPLNMIFGQVVHGAMIADLVRTFGIRPSACIGYSLGESAGLFALGAWPDRDEMLKRMLDTDLFSTRLSGPCTAARNVWGVPAGEDVNWRVAVVNRSAPVVRKAVGKRPTTRLLIVNTPDQCVIGGRKHHVDAAIEELGCEAVFLDGVATVHCDVVSRGSVADAYKNLHIFPVTPPGGVRFYSCALERSYDVTSDSAASSILKQAVSGFDFTKLIERAYQDGIRIFLEMGPHASCTGMIGRILDRRPHLSVSASMRGENEFFTILKFLGELIAQRVPVDLDRLYGIGAFPAKAAETAGGQTGMAISVTLGGKAPSPNLPVTGDKARKTGGGKPAPEPRCPEPGVRHTGPLMRDKTQPPLHPGAQIDGSSGYGKLFDTLSKNIEAVADAHKTFLDFSNELTRSFEKTFAMQTRLLEKIISDGDYPVVQDIQDMYPDDTEEIRPAAPGLNDDVVVDLPPPPGTLTEPVVNREMCMEFAVGSAEKVLGPMFAVVDTYKTRVRLPDEPLMLVDRILALEGEKGSLGSGRIITEHDVLPGAWYLDGGRAPVCISVEAGQADLFLCAYLGIDLAVKGERTYRLLDAAVQFHRGLPRPGDVIRYEIEIDHFARQGDTYLFFFRFEGLVGNSHLISMTNGCAGFFTGEEVKNSGGIILTEEDTGPRTGKKIADWKDLVPVYAERYDDDAVDALRKGNLAGCFGNHFDGIQLPESLRLPGGRMRLIDRILSLDPEGGRYGLGVIRAEADIRPNDWFLTCHFMDDMVMPGTLMYECCAHTLRVFVQRMGWISEKPDACYEPVVGVKSVLKCRGPVTPETGHVHYEVEIKEIGYAPEPYVIADALMYADGHRIVSFKDMSMKMTGTAREEIESFWEKRNKAKSPKTYGQSRETVVSKKVLFDRNRILAFAVGKPSEAFGEPYRIFDRDRTIARLPGPPYFFMDRVVHAEPEAWVLKPDGWIEAEYDVTPDAWYFRADRSASMPLCVLLEIALQPCGWLAAYAGSALRSKNDLKFRNLGGSAVLSRTVLPEAKKLTMRARMTKVSEAAEMIIEHFDFMVLQGADTVYSGDTYFGFFTKEALAQQVGLRNAEKQVYSLTPEELQRVVSHVFQKTAPLSPEDSRVDPSPSLAMPSNALRMIDRIDSYVPDGGPKGLGFIRGVKAVDSEEWFFKAHFYQDPVCPGSLGIESFLQLIKYMALERWGYLSESHRFEPVVQKRHNWSYRGQVIPKNRIIEVEAVVTEIQDTPVPLIMANGFLKVDGLYIYQMENYGYRIKSHSDFI
ncbi:MAG: beta-ketoacyl synthase N-terminal-like domain-containing protein [Pseudomonadota bacterium]